ncbi:MAG TPA: PAS domain-containing protein [Herminiimonas sp.]|nr:PAS domain-containing protein [Herminiimonas sp.]
MFHLPRYRSQFTPLFSSFIVIAVTLFAVYNAQQDLWLFGYRLVDILPIQLNTAIAFMLAGLALVLRCLHYDNRIVRKILRGIGSILALLVTLIGVITLAQYLSGNNIGIDQLFISEPNAQTVYIGRMAPLTALGFVLGGLSILLMDWHLKRHYPAEYGAFILAGVMGIPLIGHLYNVMSMEDLEAAQIMAPYVSIVFFALALGIVSARPDHPLMSLWNGTSPGGRLLRSLLPNSLLLLVALDFAIKWGVQNGLYGADKASPLLILLSTTMLFVMFSRMASLLNREYEGRRMGEAALAESNALLRVVSDSTPDAIFVKDHEGRMIFANPAKLNLLGKDSEHVIGRRSIDLYDNPADAELIDNEDKSVMESGEPKVFEATMSFPDGERTLHSTKAPWRNARGEVMGVVAISTDITERKRMEDSLKAHETQLEALVAARTIEVSELIGHLETTREEEKRSIARELHDDLGSALTALNMHLSLIFQQMPAEQKFTDRAAKIKTLLGSITDATRRIQIGLRPDKLDVFGIKVAIAEQAAEFEKYSGVECHASLPDDPLTYAPRVDIALFRMVQEALNNIAKHAHASRVDVVLDDTDDEIRLTVRDNGVGISLKQPDMMTHGLRGMRERAGYLGGSVRINSAPGCGTIIVIVIPKTAVNVQAPEDSTEVND